MNLEVSDVQKCLTDLCEEYCDFLPCDITVLDKSPTPMEFMRIYMSQNMPLVIRDGVSHWPALKKWDNNYLRSRLHNTKCTVAVTPDGFADAVTNNLFMLPEERIVLFDEFLGEMEEPQQSQIFYLQKQNNCLIDEFSPLIPDIESHIPWATEAIGELPEAVNFWMGDKRAETSLHKDHYENIYCVVRGSKEFTLYPPVAAAWLQYEKFKKASYQYNGKTWEVSTTDDEVSWIANDPVVNLRHVNSPPSLKTKCFRFNLNAGDVLYLPALWFHYVTQSHSCIAVNYWYDMKYDGKYAYFSFLERLGKL